jgi:hypothetical protein
MASIRLELDEPAWPDLAGMQDRLVHTTEPLRLTILDGGMTSGLPSVAIRLDLPDGKVVIAETSLQLFLTAADALKTTKYGDPRFPGGRPPHDPRCDCPSCRPDKYQ